MVKRNITVIAFLTLVFTNHVIANEVEISPTIADKARISPTITNEAEVTPDIADKARISPTITNEAEITPDIADEAD